MVEGKIMCQNSLPEGGVEFPQSPATPGPNPVCHSRKKKRLREIYFLSIVVCKLHLPSKKQGLKRITGTCAFQ